MAEEERKRAEAEEEASALMYKLKYGQYPHQTLKSLSQSTYAPGETVELKYAIFNNGLAAWPVGKVKL